MIFIHQSPWN